jgi:hypothetical protein
MNCKDCYVEGCTHRPFPNETECVFRQWTAKEFDWQSFRAEAAKDILCAVLPSIQIIDGDFSKSLSNAISNSIDTADELVKQLKGGEE